MIQTGLSGHSCSKKIKNDDLKKFENIYREGNYLFVWTILNILKYLSMILGQVYV